MFLYSTKFFCRYIISREDTPASKLFVKPTEQRGHFEVSPESILLAQNIAKRIESYGGLALIADYGHNGNGTDSFRAFKKHELHNPLVEPGTADLTADVDFGILRKTALDSADVLTFGPISQKDFLFNMGIEHRFKALEENAKSDKEREGLKYGFKMMTESDQMGERFKFLSILPGVLKQILDKFPVAGFNQPV